MNKLIISLFCLIVIIFTFYFVGPPAIADISGSIIKVSLSGISTEVAAGLNYTPTSVPVRVLQITAKSTATETGSIALNIDAAEGANWDSTADTLTLTSANNTFKNYGEEGVILNGGATLYSAKDALVIKGTSIEGSVKIILTIEQVR